MYKSIPACETSGFHGDENSNRVLVRRPVLCVVEYKHFRLPCCLHLQGEVAGDGKNGEYLDIEKA